MRASSPGFPLSDPAGSAARWERSYRKARSNANAILSIEAASVGQKREGGTLAALSDRLVVRVVTASVR